MKDFKNKGVTLIETLVAVAFIVVFSVAIYNVYSKILETTATLSNRQIAAALANEQFEIIRNMPYENIGTLGGIPSGTLLQSQTLTRDNINFDVFITIRNIDDPFDGTLGGIPNDLSPADNKLVAIEIACDTCKNFIPVEYTTHIAPKNLETSSTNGALIIRVYDADGIPVPDALIEIDNTELSPEIHIDDVSGIDGTLNIVDAPPSVDSYKIRVSKDGYSSEETYPIGDINNPNPTKPNQTVIVQQITQVSFFIDKVSTIQANSIFEDCDTAQNIDFQINGSKTIGTLPDVLKYDAYYTTNSSGNKTISNLEWDTYNVSVTDSSYDLIGTNPLLTLGLVPDSSQDLDLIVAPKDPARLLAVIRDQSTGLPLTDVSVRLEGPTGYDNTLITGRGFLTQTDWSNGAGQDMIGSYSQYANSGGRIETNSNPGSIEIEDVFGSYIEGGWLESSTFDTNNLSNFHQILWSPSSQPILTGDDSVKFQVASNNDGLTWNFSGPDGTGSTYYTLSDTNINSSISGNRYFRYKIYLSTEDSAYTPNVSDISFTLTTECTPPGQVSFSGLVYGEYTITVTKSGYQDYIQSVTISDEWQKEEIAISQ
ncbi:MAG: hypothetical protein KBD26_02090 [Candidatus Pacebacteria bacterium]|nr:hypothetical protein [Candidatus Paceibacterota bacterium]MBP9772602.1 hypothetical protein [Candidatus Paceibacterota bacterium]